MALPPPSARRRKARYHHGDLRACAIRRGREIVARGGPLALTLRGLARDLGVTAPALVYHFHSIEGLRVAVAASVLDELEDAAGLGHEAPPRTAREQSDAWLAYAAANPGLYRLASGETWHLGSTRPTGLHSVWMVPSPRRLLETSFARRTRERARARALAVTLHGLALARIDGVPEADVGRELHRAVEAFVPRAR